MDNRKKGIDCGKPAMLYSAVLSCSTICLQCILEVSFVNLDQKISLCSNFVTRHK